VLQRSRRFAGLIGQLARTVNRGDGAGALALLRSPDTGSGGGGGELALLAPTDPAAIARLAVQGRPQAGTAVDAAGYAACLHALAQRPAEAAAFEPWARGLLTAFDRCRVLCALRSGPYGVAGLNAAIEAALVQQGVLKKTGEWYEGRPVMVTRNEPALSIFNGDIGLVLAPPGSAKDAPLRAWFLDGDTLRSVATSRLADVETAFAMTVHKSQGSEFAHVLLVLPPEDSPVLTRELVYTGITRARSAFTLVAPEPARLVAAAGRLTRRLSGLAEALRGG
jgi:exodeoxyribonuclease V alpha subunit